MIPKVTKPKPKGDLKLYKLVRGPWEIGDKLWEDIRLGKFKIKKTKKNQVIKPCLNSVALNRLKFMRQRWNLEDVKELFGFVVFHHP